MFPKNDSAQQELKYLLYMAKTIQQYHFALMTTNKTFIHIHNFIFPLNSSFVPFWFRPESSVWVERQIFYQRQYRRGPGME